MASSRSSNSVVNVVARTWARETHNLFDFEAHAGAITRQSFTVNESVTCARAENEVEMISHASSSSSRNESEKLIQVEYRHGTFCLTRPRWGTTDDRRIQRCWQLIRDGEGPESSGQRLAEHDIIKFGRSQFRVRQVVLKGGVEGPDLGDATCPPCRVDTDKFDEMADKPCRICLLEGSTPEDPLVAPCQCKGSIQHVHLGCLRHWVRDRLGLSNGDAAFVVGGAGSRLSCELCKTPYQTKIKMGRTTTPLIELSSPFIVLESCNDHRLNVLPIVEDKPLKIGRGHECDMNIHDTSISRVQASIELKDGHFVLKDQGSRFGTYIKITKPMPLQVGQQFSVQVGRTILQLSIERAGSQSSVEALQQFVSPRASQQGDETDPSESPRGSGRSVAGALEQSSPSRDEFLSCDGH